MSLKTAVSRTVDNLFAWLDGPAAPAPAPVVKPPVAKKKAVVVPAGATEIQKRAAKLAAMSDKCRMAYIRLENRALTISGTPGAITPFKDQNGRQWFKVLSQGSAGSYNVTPKFCDCPAADSRRIHGYCKHMLAVRMYISGTKQVAAEIIKERKAAPMPDNRKTNQAIAKFLKSCCEVHFYNSGGLWRGTWLDGYELRQGGGTFEKLGFTPRQLMDYAADREEIMLAMPRKTRGQTRVVVHSNMQEHRDRKTLHAAQVLEAHGQPERPALIAERNREMVTNEHLREDFGQQVAAAIREEVGTPCEQAEPVEPEDDPGPLAKLKIVGAVVTVHGVFLTMSDSSSTYKALKEGRTPNQAYAYLRKIGLVQTRQENGGTPDATVTLAAVPA